MAYLYIGNHSLVEGRLVFKIVFSISFFLTIAGLVLYMIGTQINSDQAMAVYNGLLVKDPKEVESYEKEASRLGEKLRHANLCSFCSVGIGAILYFVLLCIYL